MSRQSKEMCKGLKPWDKRISEHLQRKQDFIELKKREIQKQIQAECQFQPKTCAHSKKILQQAQQPQPPVPESYKNPYNEKAVEELKK